MMRTAFFFRSKFGKCGKHVLFGCHNTIKGGKFIEIGDNCVFGNNLRLEAVSKYGECFYSPSIVFGEGVAINQNFHCTCANSIIIGDGTSVTANCGIFDIVHPYENITINPRIARILSKPIVIGKDCMIGMNSVILPGTHLGNHCVVGANSTVSGEYPDNCVIAGSPAKVLKRYNQNTKQWERVLE